MYKFLLFLFGFYQSTKYKVGAGEQLADYSKTVQSSYFVDKTLFLQDFLNADRRDVKTKLITAPTGFGKSTMIDMVYRFLSNEYNVSGTEVDYRNNPNYNIFCTPSKELNICKNNSKFIERHFGKYPVLKMDFSHLRFVGSCDEFLKGFRKLQSITFHQHGYLLKNTTIWPKGRMQPNGFRKRLFNFLASGKGHRITTGVMVLAGFLHKFFRKKIIILLDEYDSYWRNILFRCINKVDIQKMSTWITKVMRTLFKRTLHMEKGLVTGVLRIEENGILNTGNSVRFFKFQDNHVYSKYFGLTENEVKRIIRKVNDSARKQEKQLNSLKRYYNGYSSRDQNNTIYNLYSITTFFNNSMELKRYWDELPDLHKMLHSSNIDQISEAVVNLLKFGCSQVDIDRALTGNEIERVYKINKYLTLNGTHEIQLTFRLLFDFGFLTAEAENCYKIPNVQSQLVIGSMLTENHITRNNFLPQNLEIFLNSINEFSPGTTPEKAFKHFQFALYNLINNSNCCPKTDNELEAILLAFFAGKYPLEKRTVFNYPDFFKGNKDISNVAIINYHNVAIILKIKVQGNTSTDEELSSKQLAVQAYDYIKFKYNTLTNNSLLQTPEDLLAATYIGIGFKELDRSIAIVGSLFLFENCTNHNYKMTYTY